MPALEDAYAEGPPVHPSQGLLPDLPSVLAWITGSSRMQPRPSPEGGTPS